MDPAMMENQAAAAGRSQQRYRHLRSRVAMTECVITTATNGVALACSIEPPFTAIQSPVARLPDPQQGCPP
jgi:hypothetical protein